MVANQKQKLDRIEQVIAIVVTTVWAASMIVDFFPTDYDPHSGIHLAMMAVVGALFGRQLWRRNNG